MPIWFHCIGALRMELDPAAWGITTVWKMVPSKRACSWIHVTLREGVGKNAVRTGSGQSILVAFLHQVGYFAILVTAIGFKKAFEWKQSDTLFCMKQVEKSVSVLFGDWVSGQHRLAAWAEGWQGGWGYCSGKPEMPLKEKLLAMIWCNQEGRPGRGI